MGVNWNRQVGKGQKGLHDTLKAAKTTNGDIYPHASAKTEVASVMQNNLLKASFRGQAKEVMAIAA